MTDTFYHTEIVTRPVTNVKSYCRLALTPDAHGMLDHGLWTVEEHGSDFIILVAKGKFRESSLSGFKLAERDNQPLIFVADTDLRPEGRYFFWQRERGFVGKVSSGRKIFRPAYSSLLYFDSVRLYLMNQRHPGIMKKSLR